MNNALDPWSSVSGFFSDSVVQAVLGLLALLVVCLIAYFALSKLRDSSSDNQPIDAMLEKNFEEMRSEGDIDDQEFRKIKALLTGGTSANGRAPTATPQSDRETTS